MSTAVVWSSCCRRSEADLLHLVLGEYIKKIPLTCRQKMPMTGYGQCGMQPLKMRIPMDPHLLRWGPV